MNLLVFALLGPAAAGGFLVLERKRLARAGVAMAAGLALTVVAAGLALRATVDPVAWKEVPAALAGAFRFSSVRLSEPYVTGTMALVVRDERRHEFAAGQGARGERSRWSILRDVLGRGPRPSAPQAGEGWARPRLPGPRPP